MARSLQWQFDATQLDRKRKPVWKLEIYDVRSTTDTINDIVLGNDLDADTGPRDFTPEAREISFNEIASDYLDGMGAQTLDITITDKHGSFDPLTGTDGNWIREGNVVRLTEGDERVDEELWVRTFTGLIVGQAGVLRGRTTGSGESRITFRAYDRAAKFLHYIRTSENFIQGAAYQDMAKSVATLDMGLDLDEIDWTSWGSTVTGHTSTQFVQEEPLVTIAKIMFHDGLMPFFNGEGKLSQVDNTISKAPARVYENDAQIISIDRPLGENDAINRVFVIGLNKDMTKVEQPLQVVATASITTGYFTSSEIFPVYFSEDRSIVADNPELRILTSVALTGVETFSNLTLPTGEINGVLMEVGTGFDPWLVLAFAGLYIGGVMIGDVVIYGKTYPVGQLVAALALMTAMSIMQRIGRGEYEIWAEPFEHVFEEIRACAQVALTLFNERNETTIENHLIQDQTAANNAARRVLLREQAKANPRNIKMFHDLRLLPDDIFETVDERTYMIKSIQRTMKRGADAIIAQLACFETTPGVVP